MGNKIKKDEPAQLQDLPKLKIKYTYAVPVMGLADALAMFSFYMNPATDGNMALKLFFLFFAAVGIGFMRMEKRLLFIRLLAERKLFHSGN